MMSGRDVTKRELQALLSERAGLSRKAAATALDALAEIILRAAEDGRAVQLPALGTLRPAVRAARRARNPQTGEMILVPEKRSVGFKMSASARRRLNDGAD